ncbi:C40 family peptidase [Halobacillus campisalis]|uniref:LysM peptidoglycan-binding domain-containing protein n=1 Tax=Halobacillus campisalis TaxID=435909 RepID=A0ABW2K238_9BACI|nr:C40 family peptidase [Halobacillus campisalis]
MNKKQIATTVFGTIVGASLFGSTAMADEAHKVKSGDSLWALGKKYNTSVSDLKSWNDLNSDIIRVGQSLVVNKDSSSNNSSSSSSKSSTYKIKSGDTLSKIASKHGVSVSNLMDWNNLKSSLIITGKTLKINGSSSSSSSSSSKSSSSSNSSSSKSSASTYTVKSGDTLSKIGSKYGVSVSNLQSWNGISGHLIYVGQKLDLKKSSSSSSSSSKSSSSNSSSSKSSNSSSSSKKESVKGTSTSSNNSNLVSEAKDHIGTPYKWGGTSTSGFDCSGYLQYVFAETGTDLPRTVASMYADSRMDSVSRSNLQKGDLVFFETYKPGASHAGIYVGDNKFIHAGSSRGVEISSLSNSYWNPRYIGAKRM